MKKTVKPRKCLVLVEFEDFYKPLSYFNDEFELEVGDIVYVDGKLEGMQGRVIDITYNFHIKTNDYKKIVAVADTKLCGDIHLCGKYVFDLEGDVLPVEKVKTWFYSPLESSESFLDRSGKTYKLDDEKSWLFKEDERKRGEQLFLNDRVVYLSVHDLCAYAIVQGSEGFYEVQIPLAFGEKGYEFYAPVCDCFCFGTCKHQYAALLQLKKLQNMLVQFFGDTHREYEDFAAVNTELLYRCCIAGKKGGKLTFNNFNSSDLSVF